MRRWDLTSVQTPRLLLRPITHDDVPGLVALNEDPIVWKFTGDGPVDAAGARVVVDEIIVPQYAHGVGRLAVVPRHAPSQFWGWCGLKYVGDVDVDGADVPCFDLGYRLLPEVRENGVASEAALAVVAAAVAADIDAVIVGRAHVDNVASRRILEKCGLRFLHEQVDESAMPVASYERRLRATRAEFTDPRCARVGELNTCSSAGADEM